MYPLLFDFNQNWHVAINFSKTSQYQNENLFSHPRVVTCGWDGQTNGEGEANRCIFATM